MSDKIKIEVKSIELDFLSWVLGRMREPGGIIEGLELEGLVLLDWQQRNLVKIALTPPPLKMSFKPHEALSLRRILFGIDLPDAMGHITRNNLCAQIQCQIPALC